MDENSIINAMYVGFKPGVNVVFKIGDCYFKKGEVLIPIQSIDDLNGKHIPSETTFENLVFFEGNAPEIKESIEKVVGQTIKLPTPSGTFKAWDRNLVLNPS